MKEEPETQPAVEESEEKPNTYDCDACNLTNLSSDEVYRAYGAVFCATCFDDCTG